MKKETAAGGVVRNASESKEDFWGWNDTEYTRPCPEELESLGGRLLFDKGEVAIWCFADASCIYIDDYEAYEVSREWARDYTGFRWL